MTSEVVTTQQKCSNTLVCSKHGTFACAGCRVAMYCSSACQEMNWDSHKKACHAITLAASFEREKRLPSWAPRTLYADLAMKYRNSEPEAVPPAGPPNRDEFLAGDPRSGQIELFGSYPAIDVLRLAENEGVEHKEPIDILFVEPADLRNVIKTIMDLPENTSAPLNVFITDCTTARTARHLMLLLMALSSHNPDITAECAVPFWYAPFVPKWCFPAIRELIGPLIQNCDPKTQEEGERLETGIRRHWLFGKASLEAVVTGHVWKQGECANLDHYEKMTMSFPQAWRSVKSRYISSSQVTPFENHHALTSWPLDYNPSLFYGNFWPLKRDADPLRGWDIADINKNNETRDASHDIYGKMFYYVRDLFKRFILKLRTLNVTFHVLPYSGECIKEKVRRKFDRIETATLADENLVGIREVIDRLSPLLKAPWINPHATMITFHPGVFDKIRNEFPCPECDPDRAERIKEAVDLSAEEKALLDAYIPLGDSDPVNWVFTASGWRRRDARWLFRDPEAAWELYKDIYDFQDVANGAKVAMRATHKVVDEWALRLKHADSLDRHGRPTPEAEWDFRTLFARQQTAGYRYVEWRKLAANERRDLAYKQKAAARAGREPKRHQKYHEYLSDAGLAALERKGSRLESWMGKDKCENWTPF
ncbi:hypothetical protein F4803DRAFT_572288 [Xylaria telfairii]|nr:hypothetical protein F4803DRAFT_572288 [Xylaria telfairii]